MYKYIEHLLNNSYQITIEKVSNQEQFYIALDEPNICGYCPLADMIYTATDSKAFHSFIYQTALDEISYKFPQYPLVQANSLEKGLAALDVKAQKWLAYDITERIYILDKIAELEESKRIFSGKSKPTYPT